MGKLSVLLLICVLMAQIYLADAIETFRKYIKSEFGEGYVPDRAVSYSGKKAKNAQEAHEAIRPTDIMRAPDIIKKYLSPDQHKLYDLIWSRALSSQMKPAQFDRNTITDNLRRQWNHL